MSQDTVGGSRYFVSFKDDYSGHRVVYFIRHKSDVVDKLKEFVDLLENKFQRRVKTLRVDNGKEYCKVVSTRPVLTQVLSGGGRGEGISAARGNDVTQDEGG